jgi:hypothetical protein
LILVADSPFLQIGQHGPHRAAMMKSVEVARGLKESWSAGALPKEMDAFLDLATSKGPSKPGSDSAAFKALVRGLSRNKAVDAAVLKELIQVEASASAHYDAENRGIRATVSCSRALVTGAARVKVTLRDAEDDAKRFRPKGASLSPGTAGAVDARIDVRLARNAQPPAKVLVDVEWSFGSKKLTETIAIDL